MPMKILPPKTRMDSILIQLFDRTAELISKDLPVLHHISQTSHIALEFMTKIHRLSVGQNFIFLAVRTAGTLRSAAIRNLSVTTWLAPPFTLPLVDVLPVDVRAFEPAACSYNDIPVKMSDWAAAFRFFDSVV
jgi:hypothetical protein